jgi:trigger factor
MGFEWGAYLRMIGKRESEIREELTPTAERNLVQRLVLAEYAQAEGIEATEEELAAEMAEIEQDVQATYGDRAEEAMQGFRSEAARNSIREQILIRKAMEHLTAALTGREETEEASETEDDAEAEAESDES